MDLVQKPNQKESNIRQSVNRLPVHDRPTPGEWEVFSLGMMMAMMKVVFEALQHADSSCLL